MDATEAIRLAVRAYWAFPLLRNIIEVMSELANSRLFLKGSNQRTRDFIEQWFEKVNIWGIREQFFREWFRSANFFCYRLDGEFTESDIADMRKAFGAVSKKIPLRYIVLNPEQIKVRDFAFGAQTYYKSLSKLEKDKLTNPSTPQEKEAAKQLKPLISKDGQLKLDPAKLSALMYKTQDYEPMGVPMAFGVLKDIEAKLEFKRIDLSIARTTDRALLLMTVGETPNEYNSKNNININTFNALQAAFANEGIARTLITDYTVKGEWLIPDINKILGEEKYRQLDKDINVGLNAIIFDSGEKFANTSIKVQIFVERLKEARNAFLHKFLGPEVRRVCKAIGSKSVPKIYFEELSLKDELQYAKLAVSMAQLGFLTPDELFESLDSGKYPLIEDSINSQREFAALREEGLYMPIVGGSSTLQKEQIAIQEKQVENDIKVGNAQIAASPAPAAKGRPTGTKSPKTATAPSPVGKKSGALAFSLSKFRDLTPAVSLIHNKVEKTLQRKFGIATLNEGQQRVAKSLVASIISNEKPEDWKTAVKAYASMPKDINPAASAEIEELMMQFDLDEYTAAMCRLAKTDAPAE